MLGEDLKSPHPFGGLHGVPDEETGLLDEATIQEVSASTLQNRRIIRKDRQKNVRFDFEGGNEGLSK